MKRALLCALLLLLSACGEDPGPEPSAAGPPAATITPGDDPSGLDSLTITLELDRATVASGEEVGSTLTVRNGSDRTVTDPACHLAQTSSALVPIDDPDAELWLTVVVDCGGPSEMESGFEDTWTGPEFPARTKYGEPLPPGDYIATTELLGVTQRLEVPVEVTDEDASADDGCSLLCISEDRARRAQTVQVTFEPPEDHIRGLPSDLFLVEEGRVRRIAWLSGAPDERRLTTVWPGSNVAFPDVGSYGDVVWDWQIPKRLQPGRYELRKHAIADGEGSLEERTLEASVRFEVVD